MHPDVHKHSETEHHHAGDRTHDHNEKHHGHSHGLVDPSIVRSKAGVKAVGLSFLVLFITAVLQASIYLSSHSVALLADLIHNLGDALTALPLGLAFFLRSKKGERYAGYFVVLLIFVSACVALYEVTGRFLHPQTPTHLWLIFIAGIIGFLGNELAAVIRYRAGKKLDSPALIADGNHARVDGLVSLGVVAGTIGVALGFPLADPLVGLLITLLILRITWQSWLTIRGTE